MNRANDLVKWVRQDVAKEYERKANFLLIVDEVDDLHRTDLKKSNELAQMEKTFKKLLKKKPKLKVSFTATPRSVWEEISEHSKETKAIDVFIIEEDHTYVGIHDLDTRNNTFLCDKELSGDNSIPYTSDKTIEFYAEALTLPKGVLVCNIANPRVFVDDNVRTEADKGM